MRYRYKKKKRSGAPRRILEFLSREEVILSAIFLLAFTLRALHTLTLSDVIPIDDASEYSKYASEILTFKYGTSYRLAYRAPGYPFFLSIVYLLYGFNYQWARFAQAFLSSVSCLLVYALAKRTFSRLTGYFACFVSSVLGLYIFYSGILLSETLYIFLMLLLAITAQKVMEDPSDKNLFTCGAVLGASALTRSEIFVFFCVFCVILLIYNKFNFRGTFRSAGLIFVTALLIILPWTIRNGLVTGRFIPVSNQLGENFWKGNNPLSSGRSTDDRPALPYKNTIMINDELFKRSLDFIRDNPRQWLALCSKKFFLYLRLWRDSDHWLFNERLRFPGGFSPPLAPVELVGVLALLGMILSLAFIRKVLLFYAFLISNFIIQLAFFVEPRYTIHIVSFLIIFASIPVYKFEKYFKAKERTWEG